MAVPIPDRAGCAILVVDDVATERDQALDMALQRLRSGFDSVAGQALRGNNEVFLQLARQTLGQQQEVALRNLTEREKAVESLLAPVREALQKTHEQIARIEKDSAKPATWSRPCAVPRCAANGVR